MPAKAEPKPPEKPAEKPVEKPKPTSLDELADAEVKAYAASQKGSK